MDNPGGGASRTTEPAAGTSSATDVSLREHFGSLRQADQTLWRTMFGALSLLGFVIWRELQRRDETLNHEAARLQASVAANVSADTYAANEKQRDDDRVKDDDWRRHADERLNASVNREEFKTEARRDSRDAFGTVSNGIRLLLAVGAAAIALIGYQIARTHPANSPTPATVTIVTSVTTQAP